ncbi:MAG: molecular chaperone DnaK [Proteobacteria bacterium]|nr:molecular chaperone DnaK [Pseudomonadota bacterium]
MSSIIGIDLGTTNSVLSIFEGGKAVVIANAEGSRVTPSVVGYTENDGILVGDLARRQCLVNPQGTIYSIKRFMGKRYDEVPEADRKSVPYETCDQLNGDLGVRIMGKVYSPSEVSAQILSKFKQCAENYLGTQVKEAVITVPAYFNDAQRRATQVAGEIAGLNVRRIINEPTAAALAYGVDKDREEKVAIYDFGGGTFDISILEIGGGVIEVLATNGDSHLGGDDIDQAILDMLLDQFKAETGLDVRGDSMIIQRVREAAEKAKMELSSMVQTEIYLPFLTADQTGPKHLRTTLSRAQLEAMIRPLIERSLDCCKRAFEDAGLKPSDVSEVLFVGGSTRIPLVQAEVERYFGRAPNHSLNPDEVVALGAAIQGGVLAGDVHDIVLLDVTPLTLGVEANGGLMISLIDRNTTIPTKKTKLFSTTVDNQESVTINVYQGERHFAAENRFLGQFELAGIEPAPRAVPQIEVAFDIDANGVLRVSATNKKTNKTESLVLMGAGGLTDDEIRSAIADAEAAREADEARKAHLVAKNKLQSFVFSISRLQRENSDLASDELKKMTPPLLERADAVLANDEVTTEELEAMSNELSACSCQWYDCVYEKEKADREREEAEKAAQQQQQGPQGPQPGTENM